MKIMGNIIYIKIDKKSYKNAVNNENFIMLKMVTKTIDAFIQSSEIDYIRIINISNERSFIRRLKDIKRLVCKDGTVMYLFEWW